VVVAFGQSPDLVDYLGGDLPGARVVALEEHAAARIDPCQPHARQGVTVGDGFEQQFVRPRVVHVSAAAGVEADDLDQQRIHGLVVGPLERGVRCAERIRGALSRGGR